MRHNKMHPFNEGDVLRVVRNDEWHAYTEQFPVGSLVRVVSVRLGATLIETIDGSFRMPGGFSRPYMWFEKVM